MEISHKKITNEEIHSKEKRLAEDVKAIVSEYESRFESIGYVLETEFTRDSDDGTLTPEEREAIRSSKIEDEAGIYENGYSSHVRITVKRPKTDADTDETPEDTSEEDLSEEEAELRKNEQELEKAKREMERSVAFTTMMFVRVYKTFWREIVSIEESTDEISSDLQEFFSVLEEKSKNSEEC